MELDHPFGQMEAPLVLKTALLIFSNGDRHAMLRGQLHMQGGVPMIGDYTPVTEDLVPQMLATYGHTPLTYTSPHVIAQNHHSAVWYVPPKERTLYFAPHDDPSLKRCSGLRFPQPPLLMYSTRSATRSGLQLFALERATRPEPGTRLMLAPYLNIYDRHDVCFGFNDLPDGGGHEHHQTWEALFYDTPFSHSGGSQRRWTPKLTHTELWTAAAQQGAFDPAWLTPAVHPGRGLAARDLTLEDFLCTVSTLP